MDGKILEGKDGSQQYRLIGKVGQPGGFGVVYKAEDTVNNETVAIKIFTGDFNTDSALLENWEREAKQALEIKGDHVIKSTEFRNTTVDGSKIYYLVMELANNGSLRDLIASQKQTGGFVSDNTLRDIWLQTLKGLRAVHQQSLHRDIKPENLLFVNDTLKISDFGLAKYIDESTRSKTYKGWGTYKYMAPESWTFGKMSKATDIYSLGIVFYETATMQLPYSSADAQELEEMHKFGKIPSVRIVNPDISYQLEGIIKKMMQKTPADRYQDVDEIIAELEKPASTAQSQLGDTLSIAKQILEKQEQEKSEQEKKDEDDRRNMKASRYKIGEFVDTINQIVEEFNSSVPEQKLWLSKGSEDDYTLIWNSKDLLRFHFYPTTFTAKLKISGHTIMAHGYAEIVRSPKESEGINFILVKNDEEDEYGSWKVLEVVSSPLVPKPSYPLAVEYPVLERISKMGNAMDIFNHAIRDDVPKEIQDMVRKAFEYLNAPPPRKPTQHIYDPETMFDEEDTVF